MATNIPTVEEFNEELPVSSWDRNTVADGNWLQANTIGPLKNRDDKIIELLQDLEGASNSWKNWSEDHDTDIEGDNNYYIGSGNSAHGNSIIIGNGNESKSTDKLIKDNNTKVYNTQNFIVGNDNSANTTRNAFIFGSKNYSETTQSDLELDSTSQNNDGFTLAFGLENSAIRNYDIAIGKGVLASGGENIVIGVTNLNANNYYLPDYSNTVKFDTRSIGYQNFNIRSRIDGHNNIAFLSLFSGYDFSLGHSDAGVGLNKIYFSTIVGVNKPDDWYKYGFEHNEFTNATVKIDYGNIRSTYYGNQFVEMPFQDNDFTHARGVKYIRNYNEGSPGIIGNEFYDVSNVTISGGGEFNRNTVKHVAGGGGRFELSGSLYNNYFENVGSPGNFKLISTYGTNNIINHANGSVNIFSHSFDDNKLYDLQYIRSTSIYATTIHGNYAHGVDFPDTFSAEEGNIEYNFLYNLESLGNDGEIILHKHIGWPYFNGSFSKNIMFNSRKVEIDHFCIANANILHNTDLKAYAPTFAQGYFTENIFLNSQGSENCDTLSFSGVEYLADNIIINSQVTATFDTEKQVNSVFTQNVLFGSVLSANNRYTTENFLFKGYYRADKPNNFCSSLNGATQCLKNNIIFKGAAYNTNETYIFGNMHETDTYNDLSDSVAMYTNRSFIYGDFIAKYLCECLLCGIGNTLQNSIGTYVIGEMNSVGYLGSETAHLTTDSNNASRNFVYGVGNRLEITVPPTNNRLDRNFVYGANNYIKTSAGTTTDNAIIGTDNYFGATKSGTLFGITDHGNILGHTSDHNDRNYMFGVLNGVSKKYNSNVLIGDRNTLFSDSDLYYSNNILIGTYNNGLSGSCQIGMGIGNVNRGHHSTTIGAYLKANQHQTIMGQYNQKVDGCVRTTSAWINDEMVAIPNSGIIFAIGNGRLKAYEYDGYFFSGANHDVSDPNCNKVNYADIENPNVVELSNAMIVSADGTVSAKTYKADPNSMLGKLFDFLTTAMGQGDLHWDASTSTWSFQ
jgi:hypothetical protein